VKAPVSIGASFNKVFARAMSSSQRDPLKTAEIRAHRISENSCLFVVTCHALPLCEGGFVVSLSGA
jgi:hypothetical protein